MEAKTFLNFDLLIEREGAGFRARVLYSPIGQAVHSFVLPFALDTFTPPRDSRAATAFGKQLFDAVFANKIEIAFRSSVTIAANQNQGLRIRLRLNDVPELAAVPWELLHDGQDYLLLSTQCSLARYLEIDKPPVESLRVNLPLRGLVMLASPSDYPPLDLAGEWQRLDEALANSPNPGLSTFERMSRASLAELRRELGRHEYPILHFGGHGEFSKASANRAANGTFILEAEDGGGQAVDALDLGRLLQDYKPLRLVVLNACEEAQADTLDVFTGAAQTLVRQGVPAVVAMQFPVTDTAAKIFSSTMYGALAEGLTIDEAVGETRKAIAAQLSSLEWATPVLFTRAGEGNLLEIATLDAGERNRLNSARLAALGQDALDRTEFERADAFASRILAIDPKSEIGQAQRKRALRGIELARWYAEGNRFIAAGRWEEALAALQRVLSWQVNYRDTAKLIAEAKRALQPHPAMSLAPTLGSSQADKYAGYYEEIGKWMLKGRVVPFLGLGVNLYGRASTEPWARSRTLPTAEELAMHLAEIFKYDGPDKSDLIRVSQYATFTKTLAALYEELRSVFSVGYEPTPLHRFWAELPALLRARGVLSEHGDPVKPGETMTYPIIFTANYDDLLEQAFREVNEPFDLLIYLAAPDKENVPAPAYEGGKFIHRSPQGETLLDNANEYGDLNLKRRTTIVKIHGALDRGDPARDSYVITEDHHLAYLQGDTNALLPATLTARVKELYPLFMGCNLRNWNLRALLYRLGRTKNRPWMIQPQARAADMDYWRAFNVQVLDTPFDEFLLNLATRIYEPTMGGAQ